MLNRREKSAIVSGLEERLRKQRVALFVDVHGAPVSKLTAFRRELKRVSAELRVAKKTLLARALGAVGIGIEPKALSGELGVIFGYEDPVAPAKAASSFSKEVETFRVLKGVLGSRILEAGEVMALAAIPPREALLAQLAQVLQAPIRGLVNALHGNIRNLVVVLSRIKERQ